MEAEDKKLTEFCNITGISPETAKFYLQAANWDMQLALLNFYDTSNPNVVSTANVNMDNEANNVDTDLSDNITTSPKKRMKSDVKNIRKQNEPIGRTDRNNEQAFYAGGSVSSGQQILGRASVNSANIIMDMIRTAKSLSSVEDALSLESDISFQQPGQRLGMISGQENEIMERNTSEMNTTNFVDVLLRVWGNGFTINDGPLRTLDNLRDREFLNMITNGIAPPEIISFTGGSPVRLKVEDHSYENYGNLKKPEPFSGQGNQLGSTMSPIETLMDQDEIKIDKEDSQSLPLDRNQPVTTVQIRLNDGRRLKINLNHNHTIGDLRNYISNLGPQYSSGNFRLVTSFPSKELNDNNVTVEQAGLLNSSILLRAK